MDDCGAFSYVKERGPPFSIQEVIDFYEACGFDYGVSVDDIILAFDPKLDQCIRGLDVVPEEWWERQEITLDLGGQFLSRHRARRSRFHPVGVAQGWSPNSYARCVEKLQEIGFRRIGLGGMVALKSRDILHCLQAIAQVRHVKTQLHRFGVTRCEHINASSAFGVTSFDSTSPLRQAFKHDREDYSTSSSAFDPLGDRSRDGE
jgi:queuine/archaeosine tRNA-ribosyltransferase